MIPYKVSRNPLHLPRAEADAYNLIIAQKAAPYCESIDDVQELAIELSGHLSEIQFNRFEQLLTSVWMDWNVSKICAEIEGSHTCGTP